MTCVYDFLKSMPGISNLAVYSTPLIAYEFKGDDGRSTSAYFLISRSHYSDRNQIAGDYVSFGNPVYSVIEALQTKCQVDVGYLDQVIVTHETERVNVDRN